jgi:KaiC/GvpD/RAD55 family RecA-like ATPase
MSKAPYIPAATAKKLAEPIAPGGRHKAAMDIAVSLIGNGFAPEAVFAQLRAKFDEEKTDKELRQIVEWAVSTNPTPSGFGSGGAVPAPHRKVVWEKKEHVNPDEPKKTPEEHAKWWLGGAELTQDALSAMSQTKVVDDPKDALKSFLELLYSGGDYINVVCDYELRKEKANPKGGGKTLTRDGWLEYIEGNGVPQSKAGAWVRPNPCKESGSGKGGAFMDSDIVSHRFLLVENDTLPINMQFALFSRMKLPISCVILSGGLSAHAWVNVGAANAADYDRVAKRILTALEPFGFDQGNKNPSRLSRFPSAVRTICAKGDGKQSLLWLNPGKEPVTEKQLEDFEASLLVPSVSDRPFKTLVQQAVVRYQELFDNKDTPAALGIPTGFREFDKETGGLKPKQLVVVSGESGGGKTTTAMNIANGALTGGKKVAVFSLEMDGDEVTDLFFAMRARIDRNHFNNGQFTESELMRMVNTSHGMTKLPLWIFDATTMTAEEIGEKIFQLKRDADLDLAVIDYAQIVDASDKFLSREQQVAHIATYLREVCKAAGVAMVILSQLNDDGRLRESRVIAHVAHTVMAVENKEDEGKIIINITKGRRIKKRPHVLNYEPEFSLLTSPDPYEGATDYSRSSND